jgi:sugar phosphate permease
MAVPRPATSAAIVPPLPRLISARLPVFYGWVVLACLCCAGFARQGPAVATLSIFVEPLTREFGWSRTALSGAVSLGGVLAAVAAPLIGPLLDRRGSRLVLCVSVLVNGIVLILLSLTPSLLVFYLLFCVARMNWAAPFELGLYGALNNWFVRRRTFASSVATLAQQAGLVAMPLIAQLAMLREGWRAGWLAIGAATLLIGFVPSWLLLVRRPEDLGLVPDGAVPPPASPPDAMAATPALAEPAFSRQQAVVTPAFWLLLLYTALIYPVQAGVSLHQAPFLIERGIDPTIAATIVSAFSLMSAAASIACGLLPRALPIR